MLITLGIASGQNSKIVDNFAVTKPMRTPHVPFKACASAMDLDTSSRIWTQQVESMFSSVFIVLILERINFIGIDLIRINFKIKWFMFNNSFKSNFDRK